MYDERSFEVLHTIILDNNNSMLIFIQNMLERQKKRESLTADDSSTPSNSSTAGTAGTAAASGSDSKDRNFNFLPGTTLHSSYVNKSYDQDSRYQICLSTRVRGITHSVSVGDGLDARPKPRHSQRR